MADHPSNVSFGHDESNDSSRRNALVTASAVGAIGAAACAIPFVSTFQPSERAKAAGASVEVDISNLQPGDKVVVEWRGKPVWVMRRTPEQLASLEKMEDQLADPNSVRTAYPTPAYAQNRHRSIKPEFLIAVGICSHLGCSPVDKLTPGAQPSLPNDWLGGFLCPCHGSTFDVAGRVFKNKPAPDNLEVPPHYYLSDTVVLIGEEPKA
jgi:ubiquinol-cytochrome c reductase iron-sulfur subunit